MHFCCNQLPHSCIHARTLAYRTLALELQCLSEEQRKGWVHEILLTVSVHCLKQLLHQEQREEILLVSYDRHSCNQGHQQRLQGGERGLQWWYWDTRSLWTTTVRESQSDELIQPVQKMPYTDSKLIQAHLLCFFTHLLYKEFYSAGPIYASLLSVLISPWDTYI